MALLLLRHWGTPDIEWRFVLAAVTSALSVAFTIVALWLERMCKLPPSNQVGARDLGWTNEAPPAAN
jgi:hypothetical protein